MAREPIDSLPLIPDKVVDKLRKGKDVPLEEISPAAAEMQSESAARRSTPVHADALSPITKEQAKRWTTGDGERLASVPGTRRVIPAPYQRPRVVASALGGHGKAWQYCRADQVRAGDIVPDLGQVGGVELRNRYLTRAQVIGADPALAGGLALDAGDLVAVGTDVVLSGRGGKVVVLDAGDQVRVFRQVEGSSIHH